MTTAFHFARRLVSVALVAAAFFSATRSAFAADENRKTTVVADRVADLSESPLIPLRARVTRASPLIPYRVRAKAGRLPASAAR